MDVTSLSSYLNCNVGPSGPMQSSDDLGEATSRLIEELDTNGNGTLDAAEICLSEEAFERADANRDGELDTEELTNSAEEIRKEMGPPPAPPAGTEQENQFDINAAVQKFLNAEDEDDEDKTLLDSINTLL